MLSIINTIKITLGSAGESPVFPLHGTDLDQPRPFYCMNKFYNRVPLTQEQKEKLFLLECKGDPYTRFAENFYDLKRQSIIEDYLQELAEVDEITDLGTTMDDARKNYFAAMKDLQLQYEGDLQMLIDMQLSMLNVFTPWRISPVAMG